MTPEETRRATDVMLDFLNGKSIQIRRRTGEEWRDVDYVHWNWADNEYRVKPQCREWWVNVFRGKGIEYNVAYPTKYLADAARQSCVRDELVHVREVIE